jgi:adenylate cyclase
MPGTDRGAREPGEGVWALLRRFSRRSHGLALGLLLIAALTAFRAGDPHLLAVLRETAFDSFQQAMPRARDADLPIAVVDVDDSSLARLGQWPWPRALLGELTARLAEYGAASVAFDMLFAEPDRSDPQAGDAAFAAAASRIPTVFGAAAGPSPGLFPPKAGIAVSGVDPGEALPLLQGLTLPLPELVEAASGVGVINLAQDDAGTVVRSLPLVWRHDGRIAPSLSLEALRTAAGEAGLVVLADPAQAGRVEAIRVSSWQVPTDAGGAMRLYFGAAREGDFISAADILGDGELTLAPLFAGRIVFVGTSAAGLFDLRRSTLDTIVPGVAIHAQALEQILTGTFLYRADWVGGLEIVIFVLGGLIICLAVTYNGPRIGALASLGVIGATIGGAWWAFAGFGVLLDPTFPAVGHGIVYAVVAWFRHAVADADRRRLRRAFAHYVEPALLVEIERSARDLQLGGEMRELTVMFSDVRNYTALSERLPPQQVLGLLNRMFDALGERIIKRHGTIDKFMGDAIMAFWNAPLDVPGHAMEACRAALGMREALAALNRAAAADGFEPVEIGIGLSTGPALVGNMGSRRRFDYSCIGETVNVAARLEGACRHVAYDILVTAETAGAVPGMALLPAGALELKGVSQKQPTYILVGDETLAADPRFAALADALGDFIADPADIHLVRCRELAAALEPGLESFLERLPARRGEMAPAPIVSLSA